MSAKTTVIFDLDGTLTAPRVGIARSYEHALGRLGLVTPARHALTRHIGPPLREVFGLLLGTDDVARTELGGFENEAYAGRATSSRVTCCGEAHDAR